MKIQDSPGLRHLSLDVSYREALRLLAEDAAFRARFMEQLDASPFPAYRWENPVATLQSVERPYECVLVNSPGLERGLDRDSFSSYFESHGHNGVAAFPNLGGDATLIVPCPVDTHSAYGHLGAFMRNAPAARKDALWQRVGEVMLEQISAVPIWLSTAGGGVAWLHVRLDARPKYYHHQPYKRG